MKYLSNYTEEATSKALKDNRAFFAFSDKQFDEQKENEIKYVSLGMGLLCPKENAEKLITDMDNAIKNGVKQDLAENGKENIIKRELANHEAYYTMDITSTAEALEVYQITKAEIAEVFNKNRNANNK